jgi:hypothetical protein
MDLSQARLRGCALETAVAAEDAVNDLVGVGLSLGSMDLAHSSDEDGERFHAAYRTTWIGVRTSFAF